MLHSGATIARSRDGCLSALGRPPSWLKTTPWPCRTLPLAEVSVLRTDKTCWRWEGTRLPVNFGLLSHTRVDIFFYDSRYSLLPVVLCRYLLRGRRGFLVFTLALRAATGNRWCRLPRAHSLCCVRPRCPVVQFYRSGVDTPSLAPRPFVILFSASLVSDCWCCFVYRTCILMHPLHTAGSTSFMVALEPPILRLSNSVAGFCFPPQQIMDRLARRV